MMREIQIQEASVALTPGARTASLLQHQQLRPTPEQFRQHLETQQRQKAQAEAAAGAKAGALATLGAKLGMGRVSLTFGALFV